MFALFALLKMFAARAKEPSTMAGISVLAAVFGIPPGTVDLVTQLIAIVPAVAAIVMPEAKAGAAPTATAPPATTLPPYGGSGY